jgi:hypothetical protein
MARPVYPHELNDPDMQWLLSTYRESHPHTIMVEISCLPVTLIYCPEAATVLDAAPPPLLPSEGFPANTDLSGDDVADEPEA